MLMRLKRGLRMAWADFSMDWSSACGGLSGSSLKLSRVFSRVFWVYVVFWRDRVRLAMVQRRFCTSLVRFSLVGVMSPSMLMTFPKCLL